MYLFGGCNSKTKPPGPCNDLYKLDLADYFWGKAETTGMSLPNPPCPVPLQAISLLPTPPHSTAFHPITPHYTPDSIAPTP